MSNRQKIYAFIIAVVVIGGMAYFSFTERPREPDEVPPPHLVSSPQYIPPPPTPLPFDGALYVQFSHEAGFFDSAFLLTLTAPEGAEIFFTLDGSYPSIESELYVRPLLVEAPAPAIPLNSAAFYFEQVMSQVTLFTIRAMAVRDGVASEIITRNFVMGTDVHERFCDNVLIFAITSDPHGLFDHYDGILVPGIDREMWRNEFFATHGRWPVHGYDHLGENPGRPANFNRRGVESERAAHVEMFDPAGNLHISQHIGIRVRGGFSRATEPQKSLELIARYDYDDRNNFAFAFFDDEFCINGYVIDRYRRLRLRNGGSDRNAGFIRDELGQALFRQAGHSVTQTHRPAVVFLNGEYYGVAWLKTPRRENHLRRVFGGVTQNFERIYGGEARTTSWWNGEPRATQDMLEVHQLAVQGFTGEGGDERFAEFSARVDVPELIRYYAMQIFINNIDWPNHNFELWRYFPTDEERDDPDLHPFLRDGRWRVFAHDIEAAWAIWDNYDRVVHHDTIYDILTGTGDRWNSGQSSAFLHAFIDREDTRAMLANAFVDVMEGAFRVDNVMRTLNDLIAQITPELEYALLSGMFNPAGIWWPSPESIREIGRAHV